MNLGTVWGIPVGLHFPAGLITTLPEMAATVAVVRPGAFDLAVGNNPATIPTILNRGTGPSPARSSIAHVGVSRCTYGA